MSAYRALIVEEREDRVVVKLHRPGAGRFRPVPRCGRLSYRQRTCWTRRTPCWAAWPVPRPLHCG